MRKSQTNEPTLPEESEEALVSVSGFNQLHAIAKQTHDRYINTSAELNLERKFSDETIRDLKLKLQEQQQINKTLKLSIENARVVAATKIKTNILPLNLLDEETNRKLISDREIALEKSQREKYEKRIR